MQSYCNKCCEHHSLSGNVSESAIHRLMDFFETNDSIDIFSKIPDRTLFGTETLFGEARGKMFGVLEGIDLNNQKTVLYGFSGQFNGHWVVPGWAPPLFDLAAFHDTHDNTEKRIKELTSILYNLTPNSDKYNEIYRERRALSRSLMLQIHDLYNLKNFRGETEKLHYFFTQSKGIPTGAGDCCGPKLLNFALSKGITPTGIVEFYWGKTNKSGTKFHKHSYPSCQDKCAPILGFLLCGLKEKQQNL